MDFGTVEYEGIKYTLQTDADYTNRLLPFNTNYNDVEYGEEFEFEMSADAKDENGKECTVYWILKATKGSEDELDHFDYDNVDRVNYDR